MNTALKMLAGATALVGLAAAPVAAGPGDESQPTIVEFAIGASTPEGEDPAVDSNPLDFDLLVQAVIATDLVDDLSKNRQLTVFAPTDQAFLDLTGAATEAEALAALAADLDALEGVLLYHVAPGQRLAEDVVPAERIRTLSKQFITKDAGSTVLNGDVNIVGVDNVVRNGVVHVIDDVLMP